MRQILLAVLLAVASAATAQTASALAGQQETTPGTALFWGSAGNPELRMTASGYRSCSAAGVCAAHDTSWNSVGGAGACAATVTLRTVSGIVNQSHVRLSYRVRATDPAQAGFQIYFATRNRVGNDTNWVLPHYEFLYDSANVYLTHTNPTVTTSATTRGVNVYTTNQDLRVCYARSPTGGPGAGDTIAFPLNSIKAW